MHPHTDIFWEGSSILCLNITLSDAPVNVSNPVQYSYNTKGPLVKAKALDLS